MTTSRKHFVPVLVPCSVDELERAHSQVVAAGVIDDGPHKQSFAIAFSDEHRLPPEAIRLPSAEEMPDGQPIAMGAEWVYPLAHGRVARWRHLIATGDDERRGRRVAAALRWWASRKDAANG